MPNIEFGCFSRDGAILPKSNIFGTSLFVHNNLVHATYLYIFFEKM